MLLSCWSYGGSSPLARGLPHAGAAADAEGGSSPLARGLRREAAGLFRGWGIIPARAGFTGRRSGPCCPDGDHPRSRGVYRSHPRRHGSGSGSSPLARGLHGPAPGGVLAVGIIPARAGFTHQHHGEHAHARDHPRSRGVYQDIWLTSQSCLGSSPLARGLPRAGLIGIRGRGIIPARAGFTSPRRRRRLRGRDHPRSRGVYHPEALHRPQDRGSSPLARGLPQSSA